MAQQIDPFVMQGREASALGSTASSEQAPMKAVNWNAPDDDFSLQFWSQNIMQFWTDDEIPLSDDKMSWLELSEDEQDVYMKVLAGLTLLDTVQGGSGMPSILEHVDSLQRKAVLSFMGMMEQIHAKSYSSIFTTLADRQQIDALFEWVEQHEGLQRKAHIITGCYNSIVTEKDLYIAMAASVLLESYLFYSGFFYPLYLAGQGKMTSCGEIIDLILRDESIHGLYVGVLAQEQLQKLSPEEKLEACAEVERLVRELYEIELAYTHELYDKLDLAIDVATYVRYNANKAMMNLGLEPVFDDEPIHPIVQNGIRNQTKQHDFFSKKGNGYIRTQHVEPLRDEDFIFD